MRAGNSSRGGRTNKRKCEREVKDKAKAWLEGDRAQLWDGERMRGQEAGRDFSFEQRERKAMEMLWVGWSRRLARL